MNAAVLEQIKKRSRLALIVGFRHDPSKKRMAIMEKSALERLSPLTGVVGVALIVAGAMVSGLFSYLPPADQLAEYLNSHAAAAALGGYLGMLSVFFLIWFAGSLRGSLRAREAGAGRIADLAFAGGVASALAIGLGFTLLSAAASRASSPDGISAVGAATTYDISSAIEGALFAVALAVMIEATAVVAYRHGAFPRWFAWVSSVLALGLLSPYSYIALVIAMLWLAVVSIWLFVGAQSEVGG
jgi:hypothetical protein